MMVLGISLPINLPIKDARHNHNIIVHKEIFHNEIINKMTNAMINALHD
jgi:hypothetical protein